MTKPIETLEVIVFSYNFGDFLADALAGIAAQRRQPDRWLVSDDCSPKCSLDALRHIVAPFPSAQLVRNERNMGPVAHFRHRISAVTADAYLVLSGDDYLVDPNFLADATAILNAHPDINVVFGQHLTVDTDGRAVTPERSATKSAWTRLDGATLRTRLAYENVVPAVCSVVRTAIHEKVPPFPLDSSTRHDWQQWYLMTYHGDFAQIDRTVVHYRVHGANISVGQTQGIRMAATVEEAYDQLLARPECSDEDRRHLRAGLSRILLRGAPLRQLPRIIARQLSAPGLSLAVAETLAERSGRNLDQVATRLRDRFLDRLTGGHW